MYYKFNSNEIILITICYQLELRGGRRAQARPHCHGDIHTYIHTYIHAYTHNYIHNYIHLLIQ